MKTLITCNLSSQRGFAGAEQWTPPEIVFGQELTLALRLVKDVDDQTVEPSLEITKTRASVGEEDLRPESGTWRVKIGNAPTTSANTTPPLAYNCSAAELAASLNALEVAEAYGTATVEYQDGSYLVEFASGGQVPLAVLAGKLWPVTLARVSRYLQDEVWVHELRLVQAPLAFTDSAERVLPPEPVVTPVQDGGSNGGYDWNELQELYVPPDFRGTYQLRWGLYGRTTELSQADTAETIQAALETVLGEGNVAVTNPDDFKFRIEFKGELGVSDQELLVAEALSAPLGDLTFTLAFDKQPLLARLRREASVTVPLEVWIWAKELPDTTERKLLAMTLDLTILRPVAWDDQALVPAINWLRPPSPRSYRGFNPDNTAIGTGHGYPELVGDGVATEFVVDHPFATDLTFVKVRLAGAGGKQLVEGTDFEAYIEDEDSVRVEALGDAPAEDAWLVVVYSLETVEMAFGDLTIEIDQVNELQDRLDAIGALFTEILEYIPTGSVGATDTTSSSAFSPATIPNFEEVFPVKPPSDNETPVPLGGLLPAIHDATVTSISSGGLPALSGSAGSVYQNNTDAVITVPGGLRIPSAKAGVGGYVASDGRKFYLATKRGTTNTFFATYFERELLSFDITEAMLRAGTTLNLRFELALQLLKAPTRAQWVAVIEHGVVTSETSPATTAQNLKEIVWNETPLLRQRMAIGPFETNHLFGAQVLRSKLGAVSANQNKYGLISAADSTPASANFALRARLIDFDTQDSVPAPRGAVSYKLSAATVTIQ